MLPIYIGQEQTLSTAGVVVVVVVVVVQLSAVRKKQLERLSLHFGFGGIM
jgi:hypothetical protein